MTRRLYGKKASSRHRLEKPLTVVDRNILILLAPHDENGPRMLSDALHLFILVDLSIADDLGKASLAEAFVSHLLPVTSRPVRKVLGVQKIAQLFCGPPPFVEEHC